jgi:hypothetical protein
MAEQTLHHFLIIKFINMLHSVKKLTAAALLLLVAAYSCKREALTEKNFNAATGTPKHKVQQWLNAQPKPTGAASRTAGNALPKNTLQWGQARYSKTSATHFIPAALLQEGKGNPYVRAGLVATEDAGGLVTAGHYMVVLANRQKMGNEAAKYYNLARLYKQEPPTGPATDEAGFSGSVVYYNTSGQQTASRVYDNGQIKQGVTAVLTAKPQPAGSEANKLPRNCDGPGQEGCIDWYWQTFVEEYQFTTCCNSSSGGGAITNDESPCASVCNNIATLASQVSGNAMSTYSVSSGAVSAPDAQGIIRQPKTLTINFYKLTFFWGFYAHCSAIYTGVAYKLNRDDPNWKWESLLYVRSEITDGTVPPCSEVVPTVTPAPIVFSADKRYASIDFAFNVKAFFTCGTPYPVHNYSSTNPSAGVPRDAAD